ncbi:hypothetical protein Tco_0378725 [Tanacetum coccineum]
MTLSGPSVQRTKHPSGALRTSLYMERHVICRLSLEHKAYWALKHANFDLKTAGKFEVPAGRTHLPFVQVFPYGTVEFIPKLRAKLQSKWSSSQALLWRMSRIFEASRARGICPSITRASHPQLHLGIRYPNLID